MINPKDFDAGVHEGEQYTIQIITRTLARILDGDITGQQMAGRFTPLQEQYQRIINLVNEKKKKHGN